TTTIPVPEAWDAQPGFTTDEAVYERQVTVPSSWQGKVVKLEFEGVNHIADVYVDDTHVANHVGGWTSFSADITPYVEPGETFTVSVHVRGGNQQPIVDASGTPLWPVGWFGHEQQWGIIFDTWMRAYGKVHIEDSFVQTSYRDKTLTIDYTLTNADTQAHAVTLHADAVRNGTLEKRISQPWITLDPGESKTVTLTTPWENPALWNPETPELYTLESRLVEARSTLDQEWKRFGFREIWIEDNQFYLNGTRLNLWGENMNYHGQGFRDSRYRYVTPDTWPKTVDTLLGLNIRVLRIHQQPAPQSVSF
ncbi:MAG: hypothetical protein M3220_01695, partial [Chloroflexota bacterium]|nr:hypothetical protein [Chloroflexota bacterium]